MPVGTTAFQQSFMRGKLRWLQRKCQTLVILASALDQRGIHVCLHLLCSSVLASCVHLLRGLPTTSTVEWVQQCDHAIIQTLCELLHICLDTSAQYTLLQLPVGFGGMGFLFLSAESSLFGLSQQLHLRSLGTIPDSAKQALTPSEKNYMGSCQPNTSTFRKSFACQLLL